MSITSVTINSKPLQEFMHQLHGAPSEPRYLHAIGKAVATVVKVHLQKKDAAEPNKLGGPREHYYAKAASATSWSVDERGVVVSVSQVGINLHYHGGTVRPTEKKALAIPISPLSKGTTARDFERSTGLQMFKLPSKKGKPETIGILAVQFDDHIEGVYVLRRSSKHAPDPTVLPKKSAMRGAAIRAIQRLAARDFAGGGNS
ncbi:MAG: hypothetical protein E1N59_2834 [Puniceicoccaceae bacterium 5H]|nr:MAG: hypothetical protein E1N59_2834 [Puniceicoccaceae bacterium 5H]